MKLTPTEANILDDLKTACGKGRPIIPEDVFPARNNRDNAARQTVRRLAAKGALVHHPDYPAWANVYAVNGKSTA